MILQPCSAVCHQLHVIVVVWHKLVKTSINRPKCGHLAFVAYKLSASGLGQTGGRGNSPSKIWQRRCHGFQLKHELLTCARVQRRTWRLATWYLPGGPVGPATRWATTSNVKVCQTTYPVKGEGVDWKCGHEIAGREIDGPSNREWKCRTWICKTWQISYENRLHYIRVWISFEF